MADLFGVAVVERHQRQLNVMALADCTLAQLIRLPEYIPEPPKKARINPQGVLDSLPPLLTGAHVRGA